MKSSLCSFALVWMLAADAAAQGPTGQQLLAQAAKRVAAEPAISAELRYRTETFGRPATGTGRYLQLASGVEKLLRLDLRMQAGERPATLLEIRGPDFFWVRREVPPASATLGRVNLRQLRQSLSQSTGEPVSGALPQGDWIMLGGLPRLLTALDRNFAFNAPRQDKLEYQSAENRTVQAMPIWIVSGAWKPDRLAALAGETGRKGGRLPEQIPDQVELMLGDTEVLPLFPYRVTYFRAPEPNAKASAEASEAREMLRLELFNVSRDPRQIDPREFQYQPGDQEIEELTPFYVQRLGSETKLR